MFLIQHMRSSLELDSIAAQYLVDSPLPYIIPDPLTFQLHILFDISNTELEREQCFKF